MTARLSFCLKAATSLNDQDLAALTDSIEAYVRSGMDVEQAETLAINDLEVSVGAERSEMVGLLRAQHADLFSPDRPALPSKEAEKPEVAANDDLGDMFDELLAEQKSAAPTGTRAKDNAVLAEAKAFAEPLAAQFSLKWSENAGAWTRALPDGRGASLEIRLSKSGAPVYRFYLGDEINQEGEYSLSTVQREGLEQFMRESFAEPYTPPRDPLSIGNTVFSKLDGAAGIVTGFLDAENTMVQWDGQRRGSAFPRSQLTKTKPVARTATAAAGSAVVNTAKALDNAIDGLGKLFGGAGKFGSGPAFDEKTYEQAKPLFAAAVANLKDAASDIREAMRTIIQMVVSKFGAEAAQNMKPYVVRFIQEVRDGTLKEPSDGTRQLDQPSPGALERAPAADVRAPGAQPEARGGAGERSNGDGGSNASPDAAGAGPADGVGGSARGLPVPPRRGRKRAQGPAEPGLFGAPGPDEGSEQLRSERGGLNPEANPAPNGPAIPAPEPIDFTIDDDLGLGEGGQKTKYRNNVAAIRLVRDLEATGRLATPEEQRVLAKYVGWGGISQAFDPANADWSKEHAELKELMSPEEFAAAARSTRYAHYTSREIIVDGIYSALRRFGFTGGKTLEAGAGVGNFLGLMPADMRAAGRFTAVEREPFSSAIARHLYPKQNVQQADFTEFKGTDGYFDAAVGNPPFASDPQTDRSGRKHLSGLTLHNYFFAKAVDMLREGGIMGQVITNGFMDAKNDTTRRYIGERTRFLGAIRLPNNAFSKNANTEVTTDIVFLQKLPDSEIGGKEAKADAKRWRDTVPYEDKNGKMVALNRYFAENPQMMLGDYGAFGTMYGPEQPALVAREGQDTLALLRAAVEQLPEGVYKSLAETGTADHLKAAIVALKNPPVREGGYFLEDGKLLQRLTDVAGEARGVEITPETQWTEKTKLGEPGFERIKALSQMRATVRALIAAEMADDDRGMGELRAKLNEQYDAYRDEHGLLNDPGTLRVFDDDPDYPLLASLENNYKAGLGKAAAKRMGVKPTKSSAEKSAIFTRRVVAARAAVRKVSTPADALAVSMAERGKLDAGYIGELLGIEPEAVLKELSSGENPQLFLDPATNEYVLRDAYLSGNVRAKLAQAKEAGMFENARALEAVQPEDVGAHEIVARVGSPWVPEAIYEAFARELFGEATEARIRYIKLNSSFQVSIDKANSVSLANTWGTAKMPADSILSALLNNKPVKVTYIDADKKLRTDIEATEAANIKAQNIRDRFGDWLFKDADRAEMLVRAYNDTNNNYVTRVYDGSMMTFPGKVPDEIIKFRRHQRNAIARTVQDRTALFDHVVGAGKTFTVIAAAMELKRTGLAKKPMVAVPNHLVKQWAADFYRLYPGANILTATKKDFLRENRRKFLAKIATGDWDAVVIAHSSFGFIKPAPEFEAQFNEKQIADIVATIQQVEDGDGDKQQKKRTVKQLEGLKERLENHIKSLRDKPMDDLLDFQQIGVDQLFVDEFHMFKNLMFSTKMQNVQGLGDSAGSQRAYDMYVKINQIYAQNGRGQGFVAATGTPVSNSLAEMYHMMRYLMPDAMEATGFGSFDAWANTFASVEQVWMQKPSGDGFKASNRMSNFVNTPELLKMFDQVSDTVTQDDIKTAYREENNGAEFPLPVLKTGRRQPISLDKSEAQDAYMAEIAKRALKLEQKKGPPKKGEDNTLVIMGDARKAAMDIRLVNPDITVREKGGRIDRSAQEIFSRYKQYDHVKGTQVVFSDLGTPLSRAKTEMKEYEELRARIDAATEDVQADAALGSEQAKAILEDAEEAQAELDAQGSDWLSAVKSALRGFSVYDDLRQALVERGIPEAEVAFIHEYNTDDQKAALFQKVNAGQIRVLIGSTAKMGAGTNVQERLVAEHHLDVPWRPSDVEQREGRIIRQGNILVPVPGKNPGLPGFEVEILAYVTKDTLDMRMWQIQETKLKMINQLRSRKVAREIDNAFEDMEMSAGEMQAAATGNVDLLKEIQLRTDVKKLEQRQRSFDAQASDLQSRRNRAERMAQTAPLEVKKWAPWAEAAQKWLDTRDEPRPIDVTIDGKKFTSDAEAGAELRRLLDAHQARLDARKAGYDAARAAAKEAFPGEDPESAGRRLEAVDVFSKANPMPKLAIEFNGETYGSKVAIAEAFTEFVGDGQRFDWEFDGKAYVHRQKAAAAMADRVMEAITSQTEQEIGTFGPFSVSVEGMVNKISGPRLDVIVRHAGKTISDDIAASPTDPKAAALSAIERAGQLVAGSRSRLMFAEQDVARAEKALKELGEVKEQGEWPDRPKLEAARAAHKEVLARLSAKKAEPAAPADGDAAQLDMAEDDFPDTIPMERVGFMDSRDEDAAAMAQETLRKHAPQSLGGVVIFALPRPEKPGPNASAIERERYASVDLVEKLFGKRVVFFGSNKVFGNGMNLRNLPDTIFINELSERPFMAVTGHEMTHSMRDSHPELYDRLAARIKELLNGKESDFYAHLRKRRLEANLPLLNAEQLEEELIANIVGDNWTDPVFWRHLAAGQPTLFLRVLSAIRNFFDDLLAKLRNERPYGTGQYLKDVEAARAVVVDIMREMAEGKTIQSIVPEYAEAQPAAEAQPMFDLTDADKPKTAGFARKIAQGVHDMVDSPATFNWWHKSLGTQFHKAKISPTFKRVFDSAQDYLHDTGAFANRAADLAQNLLPSLKSFSSLFKRLTLSTADQKAVASAVFNGTLENRIYTRGELKAQGMTDEQIGLYQQFRAATNKSLDQLVAGEVSRLVGDIAAPYRPLVQADRLDDFREAVRQAVVDQKDAADAALAAVKKRHKIERTAMEKAHAAEAKIPANTRPPTQSLMEDRHKDALNGLALRQGQERYRGEQEQAKWEQMEWDVADRYEKIDNLKANGYAPLMRFGQYTVTVSDAETGETQFFGMYESRLEMNRAHRALREEFGDGSNVERGLVSTEAWKLFKGVSPETLAIFGESAGMDKDERSEVFQKYLRLAVANHSALKRLIKRKGTPGFSMDPTRVLAAFITSNARRASGLLHFGDMAQAVEAARRSKLGDVADEAERLREYVQNPVEEAAAMKSLMFVQYLGGSLASAMVNMTQPVSTTLPYLSSVSNPATATARIGQAIAMLAPGAITDKSELGKALKMAEDEGIVAPQEMHELQAEATRTLVDKLPMGREAFRKGMFVWGSLFSFAESINRRITFVAAYNMAKEMPESRLKKMGFASPFAFAADAVDNTQFVYTKTSRPRWARGAVGGLLLTFKTYSISYLELFSRLPKREKVLMLATLIAMAGASGLPGADDLDDLIDSVGQRLGYDTNSKDFKQRVLTQAFGPQWAALALRGVTGLAGSPIDVAGRLSMGNLIPGTGLLRKDVTDAEREIFEFMGPLGSSIKGVVDAMRGDPLKTAPSTVANVFKAIDMIKTGAYRDARGNTVIQTTPVDAAVKAAGFQPGAVAQVQRQSQIAAQRVALARVVENEIVADWAAGIFEKDRQKQNDARERLTKWNRNNPRTPIEIKDSQIERKVQNMMLTRQQRAIKAAPPEMRQSVANP